NVYFDKLRDAELVLPAPPEHCGHAWHLFVIRHPKRDQLQKALEANQIGTLIHYPIPPHRQEAYAELRIAAESYPIANQMAQQVLSLPMGPHMSETDAHIVADHVLDFLG
ncbi:MAG TPA: erythromycin biosynthesis sensory transduction protein eryC1, partial [Thalassospira sp.]|nr:erythromycin biosynthesis sensory transduction protein eryC1 [Thalassospira sp.]